MPHGRTAVAGWRWMILVAFAAIASGLKTDATPKRRYLYPEDFVVYKGNRSNITANLAAKNLTPAIIKVDVPRKPPKTDSEESTSTDSSSGESTTSEIKHWTTMETAESLGLLHELKNPRTWNNYLMFCRRLLSSDDFVYENLEKTFRDYRDKNNAEIFAEFDRYADMDFDDLPDDPFERFQWKQVHDRVTMYKELNKQLKINKKKEKKLTKRGPLIREYTITLSPKDIKSTEPEFYHGSTVGDRFICSQAPANDDDSQRRFWKAIVEYNVKEIVNVLEREYRIYYPLNIGETKEYGEYSVKLLSVKTPAWITHWLSGFSCPEAPVQITVMEFQVKGKNFTKKIIIYRVPGWVDNATPLNPLVVIPLLQIIMQKRTLIHCAAGIGRSATFLALMEAIRKIIKGEIFNILGVVKYCRVYRPEMVYVARQFIYIHYALLKYADLLGMLRNISSAERARWETFELDFLAKNQYESYVMHSKSKTRIPQNEPYFEDFYKWSAKLHQFLKKQQKAKEEEEKLLGVEETVEEANKRREEWKKLSAALEIQYNEALQEKEKKQAAKPKQQTTAKNPNNNKMAESERQTTHQPNRQRNKPNQQKPIDQSKKKEAPKKNLNNKGQPTPKLKMSTAEKEESTKDIQKNGGKPSKKTPSPPNGKNIPVDPQVRQHVRPPAVATTDNPTKFAKDAATEDENRTQRPGVYVLDQHIRNLSSNNRPIPPGKFAMPTKKTTRHNPPYDPSNGYFADNTEIPTGYFTGIPVVKGEFKKTKFDTNPPPNMQPREGRGRSYTRADTNLDHRYASADNAFRSGSSAVPLTGYSSSGEYSSTYPPIAQGDPNNYSKRPHSLSTLEDRTELNTDYELRRAVTLEPNFHYVEDNEEEQRGRPLTKYVDREPSRHNIKNKNRSEDNNFSIYDGLKHQRSDGFIKPDTIQLPFGKQSMNDTAENLMKGGRIKSVAQPRKREKNNGPREDNKTEPIDPGYVDNHQKLPMNVENQRKHTHAALRLNPYQEANVQDLNPQITKANPQLAPRNWRPQPHKAETRPTKPTGPKVENKNTKPYEQRKPSPSDDSDLSGSELSEDYVSDDNEDSSNDSSEYITTDDSSFASTDEESDGSFAESEWTAVDSLHVNFDEESYQDYRENDSGTSEYINYRTFPKKTETPRKQKSKDAEFDDSSRIMPGNPFYRDYESEETPDEHSDNGTVVDFDISQHNQRKFGYGPQMGPRHVSTAHHPAVRREKSLNFGRLDPTTYHPQLMEKQKSSEPRIPNNNFRDGSRLGHRIKSVAVENNPHQQSAYGHFRNNIGNHMVNTNRDTSAVAEYSGYPPYETLAHLWQRMYGSSSYLPSVSIEEDDLDDLDVDYDDSDRYSDYSESDDDDYQSTTTQNIDYSMYNSDSDYSSRIWDDNDKSSSDEFQDNGTTAKSQWDDYNPTNRFVDTFQHETRDPKGPSPKLQAKKPSNYNLSNQNLGYSEGADNTANTLQHGEKTKQNRNANPPQATATSRHDKSPPTPTATYERRAPTLREKEKPTLPGKPTGNAGNETVPTMGGKNKRGFENKFQPAAAAHKDPPATRGGPSPTFRKDNKRNSNAKNAPPQEKIVNPPSGKKDINPGHKILPTLVRQATNSKDTGNTRSAANRTATTGNQPLTSRIAEMAQPGWNVHASHRQPSGAVGPTGRPAGPAIPPVPNTRNVSRTRRAHPRNESKSNPKRQV